MALESILVILPDTNIRPHYWREFSAEGYSVVIAGSLAEALDQLSQRSYDVVVFDIDEEVPSAALAHISALKRRHCSSLVVQGSPMSLAQLLAEFSQRAADKSATLEADALVFKCDDVTELRITLKDLLARRQKFSNNGNSAAS
jgi:DNA-binding NtrC family response regulator